VIDTHDLAVPESELSPPYSRYADFYDRLNQSTFSTRLAQEMLTYFEGIGHFPGKVLDLACGTGAAAHLYAQRGCKVVGLERSNQMLAHAKRRADGQTEIRFLEGDLRDLRAIRFNESFDLVSCYFDSINYLLLEEEIVSCFQAVHALTVPGGFFVFDVPTRWGFTELWDNATHVAIDEPDLFGLYRSSYDPVTRLSPLQLTIFQRVGSDETATWTRFDECHTERAYTLSELTSALSAAGYTVTECFDVRDNGASLLPSGDESAHRVAFVAQRLTELTPAGNVD